MYKDINLLSEKNKDDSCIEKYLNELSWSNLPVKSDWDLEKYILLAAKVEFKLICTLNNSNKTSTWLPGVKISGAWVTSSKYKINLRQLCYNPYFITRNVHDINTETQIAINTLPEFNKSSFVLIRLFAIHNNIYNKNRDYDDVLATYKLADHLRINTNDDNIFSPYNEVNQGPWRRSAINNPKRIELDSINTYNFYGENGVLLYTVREILFNGENVILPVTYWIKSGEVWGISQCLLPGIKQPLFNLDCIIKYKRAFIVITEDLKLASKYSPNENMVFTSWYGGKDAIEHVAWSTFNNRKVYYLLIYNNTSEFKIRFKIALELFEKFMESPYIDFSIIDCSNRALKFMEFPELLPQYKFNVITGNGLIELAKTKGFSLPKKVLNYINRFIVSDGAYQKNKDVFILKPFLKKNNIVVLYAPAGLGKSWLALSIGLAVSKGVNVLDGWDVPTARSVYYISGEMSRTDIEDRISLLDKGYIESDSSVKGEFIARRVSTDLSLRENQLKMEKDIKDINRQLALKGRKKLKLIIFDNLTTLVPKGFYIGNFEKFFTWLDALKESGLSVLLIHHANSRDKILGTSAIKNKTDFLLTMSNYELEIDYIRSLIRIVDSGDRLAAILFLEELKERKEIVLYIYPEKIRSSSKKDIKPILVSFDPAEEYPRWKLEECIDIHSFTNEKLQKIKAKLIKEKLVELQDNKTNKEKIEEKNILRNMPNVPWKKLTLSQKRDLIIEMRNSNMTSTEMAEYYKVSKSNIDKIRAKTKTRDSDLGPRNPKSETC